MSTQGPSKNQSSYWTGCSEPTVLAFDDSDAAHPVNPRDRRSLGDTSFRRFAALPPDERGPLSSWTRCIPWKPCALL